MRVSLKISGENPRQHSIKDAAKTVSRALLWLWAGLLKLQRIKIKIRLGRGAMIFFPPARGLEKVLYVTPVGSDSKPYSGQKFWSVLCSQMTSTATHFVVGFPISRLLFSRLFCVAPLGAFRSSCPSSLNRLNPWFLRYCLSIRLILAAFHPWWGWRCQLSEYLVVWDRDAMKSWFQLANKCVCCYCTCPSFSLISLLCMSTLYFMFCLSGE